MPSNSSSYCRAWIREAHFTLIGRHLTLTDATKTLELSSEDLEGLRDRIKHSNLSDKDVRTILSIFEIVITLRALVAKRKLALLSWLRRIFGFKTEKESQKGHSLRGETTPERTGRHGRNGRETTTLVLIRFSLSTRHCKRVTTAGVFARQTPRR